MVSRVARRETRRVSGQRHGWTAQLRDLATRGDALGIREQNDLQKNRRIVGWSDLSGTLILELVQPHVLKCADKVWWHSEYRRLDEGLFDDLAPAVFA
jgi:hypothetical protein